MFVNVFDKAGTVARQQEMQGMYNRALYRLFLPPDRPREIVLPMEHVGLDGEREITRVSDPVRRLVVTAESPSNRSVVVPVFFEGGVLVGEDSNWIFVVVSHFRCRLHDAPPAHKSQCRRRRLGLGFRVTVGF